MARIPIVIALLSDKSKGSAAVKSFGQIYHIIYFISSMNNL